MGFVVSRVQMFFEVEEEWWQQRLPRISTDETRNRLTWKSSCKTHGKKDRRGWERRKSMDWVAGSFWREDWSFSNNNYIHFPSQRIMEVLEKRVREGDNKMYKCKREIIQKWFKEKRVSDQEEEGDVTRYFVKIQEIQEIHSALDVLGPSSFVFVVFFIRDLPFLF